ncbi:aldehyde dehydrogenase (NADP(+)) [Pseudomonas sp. Bout1]|uniref:aldehyde dehydrogenase (NADP(+)) n=1 Tax=Pseudomonas sp. Bout1 TaxID=3048600 RepID=UPI002AB3D1F3|nr:aldehyde dehydrogenase (NADP(+)) [Pseudomonas sp. Bout1]MDY7533206.1 aldehyde dehydrogenase (NADP(+)) [Pseudomonas sp. Bout1]MEB0183771.1 aldehyde dehydrogenase (NADP(+)) [Pseudomonas sp. Bout1]
MSFTAHGKHLIAGQWVATDTTFSNAPTHGPVSDFSAGSVELVNRACEAAEEAFWSFGYSTREARATFLNTIADEIEARAETITAIGSLETGLPEARLQGERGRTVGQLRLFAAHILAGDYLDRRHDVPLPDRQPLPRPDIRLMQRPLGPVAVFGASNFPLAFSTAGGDVASALAAGCPVVVKGHEAHPGTSEIMAEAIHAAIEKCAVHPGVFSLVHGGSRAVGQRLVQHPLIKAVGFTGSLAAGRALFDLCAKRFEPIAFYGELGSVNPMFLMPHALRERGLEIARGWAGSLTQGAGQFCTNPGVAVLVEGEEATAFIRAVVQALGPVGAQVMLTEGIAAAYRAGRDRLAESVGVREVLTTTCELRQATPYLFATTGREWLANASLGHEVFGPLGLVVTVANVDELLQVARSLEGQLTCTLHMDAADTDEVRRLLPILERKAGRILANGFPTGVEVSEAMVHGGPYPASTNFGATSVGTMAIRRFLRPVSYQNIPSTLLPLDLRYLSAP